VHDVCTVKINDILSCVLIPEVSANTQDREGSPQEVPSQYINLDPDHCHPVKNPAYVHVSLESSSDRERSSQEVPRQSPTYINLDPDHCHPVKNPAYVHVSFESS
jgi:hypothetical protein